MMDALYIAGPVGVIAIALGARRARQMPTWVAAWVSLIALATAAAQVPALAHGRWPAIVGVVTDLIAATSAWDSVRWLAQHPRMPSLRYYVWWALFWGALVAIATANNLGVAWVAIEFSTLSSAALIAELGHRRALEAAWKYVLIASIGLALGLVGIIFVYGSLAPLGLGWQALSFPVLAHHAHQIPRIIRELAMILVVSGFGTKAGLVPFHTWLPDAHSEAPSPVSGLLSGVLLGLCLLTIERFRAAVPLPATVLWTGGHLLAVFGGLSVLVGSLALLGQRDIKRLLAYSSIEQMGLVAIGLSIGTPLAITAALLQFVFHAVIKSGLFFEAGHLAAVYRTQRLTRITGIWRRDRRAGVRWSVGILALAGMPPLGLAFSEWMLLDALWRAHQVVLVLVISGALLITFAALVHHWLDGLWGGMPAGTAHASVAAAALMGEGNGRTGGDRDV